MNNAIEKAVDEFTFIRWNKDKILKHLDAIPKDVLREKINQFYLQFREFRKKNAGLGIVNAMLIDFKEDLLGGEDA